MATTCARSLMGRAAFGSSGKAEKMGKTVSKRLRKAAEQYLASLGSSRDCLTPAQWQIVTKHIRNHRTFKWVLLLSICAALLCLCNCILLFHVASELLSVYSDDLVMNAQQSSNQETQDDFVRNHVNLILLFGANIGGNGILVILFPITSWKDWFSAKRTDKTLRAFICPAEPHATSLDKSASPQ